MAQRSSSRLAAVALCLCAGWLLAGLVGQSFVAAPGAARPADTHLPAAVQTAVLASVLAVPQAAHAASSYYALVQLGWSVFIIGLGPAVLFWIYFN
eukprot:CAMPEP_0171097708 /NCGR_PEP_ID=MMETSP0766_2-20121228/47703_1 /TAXON_ID=439317 /ORGANISM="Gambierdiscus australes, Strain CAWD 149" /LENGTH=95 /DNA_ID=CAMNT_0011556945 /DNA_START=71 /DNA_END=355 /DNA_ORIENTATION=+